MASKKEIAVGMLQKLGVEIDVENTGEKDALKKLDAAIAEGVDDAVTFTAEEEKLVAELGYVAEPETPAKAEKPKAEPAKATKKATPAKVEKPKAKAAPVVEKKPTAKAEAVKVKGKAKAAPVKATPEKAKKAKAEPAKAEKKSKPFIAPAKVSKKTYDRCRVVALAQAVEEFPDAHKRGISVDDLAARADKVYVKMGGKSNPGCMLQVLRVTIPLLLHYKKILYSGGMIRRA